MINGDIVIVEDHIFNASYFQSQLLRRIFGGARLINRGIQAMPAPGSWIQLDHLNG